MSPHAIRHSSIVNIIHPAFNPADQKRFTLTDQLNTAFYTQEGHNGYQKEYKV
ncbi:hypothetical protein [Chromatium okenii]|uniref:hypothetical protein n=1 Tax=Chromatium okenii TaxID=61644 RepID=UPI001558D53D|nr:hypothetical protein [Chromatium okenii]